MLKGITRYRLIRSFDSIIIRNGDNTWENFASKSVEIESVILARMQDQKQLPKSWRPIPFRHTEWFCQNVQLSALLVLKLTDLAAFVIFGSQEFSHILYV